MLIKLQQTILELEPRTLNRPELREAGVLVAVTEDAEFPEVILTKRSTELPTHSGEVAFPGGKYEPSDIDIIDTALREAYEEIGLNREEVNVLGPFHQVVSRFGFLVTPIVATIPTAVEFEIDEGEIESLFKVPLKFFIDTQPDWDHLGGFKVPYWQFEGHKIWGLTAMMIAELMNHVYKTSIEVLSSPGIIPPKSDRTE